mmetsp:Transcript_8610/g.9869  ORF Transcript_8610/g.9869 Transcript_8610/m.9869 type:complete len:299 (-) Transcript_8610:44-940(-)
MMPFRIVILTVTIAVSRGYSFTSMPSYRRNVFLPSTQQLLPTSSPSNNNNKNDLTMRVKSGSRMVGGTDSVLIERHNERMSMAGKRGTKNFIDPNKLFVGNLPYDVTEDEVMAYFKRHLGHTQNIRSFKIIMDYKTGKSRGYGFVIFNDPMFATCAIEHCKEKKLKGRYVNLHQGQRKDDPNIFIMRKKKKLRKKQYEEERVIQSGVDEANPPKSKDIIDDLDFDGKFEEILYGGYSSREPLTEEELKMNRERRRKASQSKKRVKAESKGFQDVFTDRAAERNNDRDEDIFTGEDMDY